MTYLSSSLNAMALNLLFSVKPITIFSESLGDMSTSPIATLTLLLLKLLKDSISGLESSSHDYDAVLDLLYYNSVIDCFCKTRAKLMMLQIDGIFAYAHEQKSKWVEMPEDAVSRRRRQSRRCASVHGLGFLALILRAWAVRITVRRANLDVQFFSADNALWKVLREFLRKVDSDWDLSTVTLRMPVSILATFWSSCYLSWCKFILFSLLQNSILAELNIPLTQSPSHKMRIVCHVCFWCHQCHPSDTEITDSFIKYMSAIGLCHKLDMNCCHTSLQSQNTKYSWQSPEFQVALSRLCTHKACLWHHNVAFSA